MISSDARRIVIPDTDRGFLAFRHARPDRASHALSITHKTTEQ